MLQSGISKRDNQRCKCFMGEGQVFIILVIEVSELFLLKMELLGLVRGTC